MSRYWVCWTNSYFTGRPCVHNLYLEAEGDRDIWYIASSGKIDACSCWQADFPLIGDKFAKHSVVAATTAAGFSLFALHGFNTYGKQQRWLACVGQLQTSMGSSETHIQSIERQIAGRPAEVK